MTDANERQLAQMIVVDRQRGRILLALHKSGTWEDFYTGLLGEVHEAEEPAAAAVRIAREQAGIVISQCEHLATFRFSSGAWAPANEFEFLAESHTGELRESAVLRPEWFAIDEIPYDKMPADDALWYPAFLALKPMKGHFNFAEDGVTLLSHAIEEVATIETT
ncbi:MAG: NUDIX domain-containing protein [Myxococcota bacterium]|nr:NUDIX domain-containing protein [Myxococcota bacterium]